MLIFSISQKSCQCISLHSFQSCRLHFICNCLAANFGCNEFKIMPESMYRLLLTAIWSGWAVWLESEQTTFSLTGCWSLVTGRHPEVPFFYVALTSWNVFSHNLAAIFCLCRAWPAKQAWLVEEPALLILAIQGFQATVMFTGSETS